MKRLKKYNYIIITVICSIVVICMIYYLNSTSPFGKFSLLTIDFFHQYGPMMGEFWNRIMHGKSLLYSFTMGLGLPFFRNFLNYLSSPFNIILFAFQKKDLLMSYSIIIGLKAVFSSTFMYIFLNKKFTKNYLHIPLSLLYGFSSYFCAYYFNLMWLDGMVMLPLIILGVEKLIDDNKTLLYILSLAIMLFANYFIGYMLCIFSVIYFIFYLIIKTNKFELKSIIKKCFLFGSASLLAGGLVAIFLFPLFDALKTTSATGSVFPIVNKYAFTLKELLFNHLSGVGSTILKSGITNAPNISVGIIPFMLTFVFVINPKIKLKIKICYLCMLVLLIISFILPSLDYIWHAFHVPNDLPYRYSFLYSFILIIISGYAIDKIKDVKKIYIIILFVFALAFVTLAKVLDFKNINDDMLFMNYAIVVLIFLCYLLSIFKKIRPILLGLITIITMAEIIISTNNNWYISHNLKNFYTEYEEIEMINNKISNIDDNIYRIEKDSTLTLNDSTWYDYKGINAFSSMEYESLAKLLYSLGLPSNNTNSFYFKYNTPIINTILDLNYILGHNELDDYNKIYSGDYYSVYKNKYEGHLMYGATIKTNKLELEENPFSNQNKLIEDLTSIGDVLVPVKINKQEIIFEEDGHTIIKYSIKNNYRNNYIYISNKCLDFILINNVLYSNRAAPYRENVLKEPPSEVYSYYKNFIITGKYEENIIDVYVGYSGNNIDGIYLYEVDYNAWEKAYEVLNNYALVIDDFEEDYILSKSDFNEDKMVFTSIPYDKGWNVFIDGKKQKSFKIYDVFLGFDVSKGKHKIELKYEVPYWKISATITIISLMGIVLLQVIKKQSD